MRIWSYCKALYESEEEQTFSKLWGIFVVPIALVGQKVGYVSTYGGGKHQSGANPERS